ncbi:ATRN family protein [Megaselia abdita]
MRRKKGKLSFFFELLVIFTTLAVLTAAAVPSSINCTTDANCMNGGICRNNACVCAQGWQGSDCQFCGGKVRLTEPEGVIHDGLGNYSVSVKCSWLIDARNANWTNRTGSSSLQKPAKIRLHLENFATECGWDHLYVYDGDSVGSPLLAVFSGLMYKKDFSIRKVPEIVAESGSALLHFFSDDAYNMSGFNISYKVNGCPTNDSKVECSGFGACLDDGTCSCEHLYTGEACNIAKCPNNCSSHLDQGTCDKEGKRCKCFHDFAGNDCSQIKYNGVWSSVIYSPYSPPPASASQSASVFHDTLYIIGGESYGRGNLVSMYDFNGNVWEIFHSDPKNNYKMIPEQRYGATTVMYGDKIFMYGGVLKEGITGELWAFDVSAKTWENITVGHEGCHHHNNTLYTMCGPLKVAGHTATIVPVHNKHVMIVIFGHSPQYGYLNTVQEFNFATREWKIVEANGYSVKGGYGHSASYDLFTEKIYVYAGIVSESENSQVLSSKLYSYDPHKRTWRVLTSSPSARFLHTADFVSPGMMIVFGGNTHNDTSQSYGAKCYSQDLLVYDVACDTWDTQAMPLDINSDLARFGHSSVVFEHSLYIYGGFDGQLLSDMIKFTPGNCSYFLKRGNCLNARTGLKCIWEANKSECISIINAPKHKILAKDQFDYALCPEKSRQHMTSEHIDQVNRCKEIKDCESCVSNSFGCTYCGNRTCQKDKCRDYFYLGEELPKLQVTSLDKCPKEPGHTCDQLHNCRACSANSHCFWDPQINKCIQAVANKTYDPTDLQCPPSCASMTNCTNCTEEECIWCQNEERCVDRNAYAASFPYGQCREWTTQIARCRTVTPSGSQCGFYKTCNQCRDDPACGWCDDGSMTGLGNCLPGGASGPQDVLECPVRSWFFTACPDCQCNGHSTCVGSDVYTCQQPCQNLTTGRNCEKCKPGFWGNPVNGGACQKCECNGQGTLCNADTGKCFCSTKGLTGDHCDKCDIQNHYHGDPMKGSCFYDLAIDYQFTFNLSKKEDRHFTQINFRNSPNKSDVDADFTITCSVPAKMNITVRTVHGPEKVVFSNLNCTTFRHRFLKTDYIYGSEENLTATTFYVYVYDFQPPLWIQIAFSQYPKLNLQQFFITFSTCFLMLLLMAAILWKIKQKYDMFRRRQRMFVEMEQMASRPFSQVLIEIEKRDTTEIPQNIESITTSKKRKKQPECPSPIALEPCSGNRAAVLSLLVRLPTGGLQYTPPGQSAGIAVASALVTLGNPRRPSIDHPPKESKSKRKQSQHPDVVCT